MKMQVLAGALLAGAMAFSAPAFAQATDTATANGSTTIIRPVEITNTAGLAFGRIVKPSSGTGTVTMTDSADAVGATGAVAIGGLATSRAKFTISGEGGQTVALTIPTSFDLSNGTSTIAVTLDPNVTGSQPLGGTLGSASTLALNIGGTFDVPFDISTGAYTGSFDVTVAYN